METVTCLLAASTSTLALEEPGAVSKLVAVSMNVRAYSWVPSVTFPVAVATSAAVGGAVG